MLGMTMFLPDLKVRLSRGIEATTSMYLPHNAHVRCIDLSELACAQNFRLTHVQHGTIHQTSGEGVLACGIQVVGAKHLASKGDVLRHAC